jgi:hypothetical protein
MKSLSPAELLPRLEASVPRELVSPRALAGLTATLELFPHAPVDVVCLECRLGSEDQVDLAIGLNQRTFGAFGFVELAERSPAWSRIAALAQQSTTPGTSIHGKLLRLWLELDDAGAGPPSRPGAVPVPAVVVGIDEFPDAADTAEGRAQLFQGVLAPLAGEVAPATLQAFDRCFTALPPGPACVTDVGVFLSRDSPIRICIGNLRDDELPPYLARIGWPSHGDVLARILDATAQARSVSPRPSFLVHLDVGAELRPRIGLEFLFERQVQLAGAIAEAALLDVLVAQGWCLPHKRAALDRWPGHVVEPHAAGQRLCILRLNSIKLAWDAAGVVQAKAYLIVLHVAAAERSGAAPLAPSRPT